MTPRKICVITGSRAEYGLLYQLLLTIRNASDMHLQLVVAAMHLSPEFGYTLKGIEADGFDIDAKVEMILSGDTWVTTAKSIGLGTIGFADAFDRLQPDIIVLPGDRFEILAAAQAALIAKIPVAHLFGGDITEGSFDDAMRHSITKMSHLHFVTNDMSAQRVRQLGENPKHIYTVGSPAIDHIMNWKLLDRVSLENNLGLSFKERNILVTFHPPTLEKQPASEQLNQLLSALEHLGDDVGVIFTKPNADPGGRTLINRIDEFVDGRTDMHAYMSLGRLTYLSVLAQVDAVVGNSSSGIYEAPSFGIPTVNIGKRQNGRIQASSIINCGTSVKEIADAIDAAFQTDCSDTDNPYGDGTATHQIVDQLRKIKDLSRLVRKQFYVMETNTP